MAEIARKTDRQLFDIYFKEPAKPAPAKTMSPFEVFRWVWKRRGWNDAEIRQRWDRKQQALREMKKEKRRRGRSRPG